jgi:hypothetical protein|tara:strand:+ start:7756 stop:8748 length:993 start_codon:yes stop_codon:yes gene_type:complete
MKKYKLIQIYPGSPELNHIASSDEIHHDNFSDYMEKKYPEFWEEVVEKDYKIITWSNPDHPREHTLTDRVGWDINSIKRLSDGEIFTVGDTLLQPDYNCEDNNSCITEIFISNRSNVILSDGGLHADFKLAEAIKYKKPLFTTDFQILSFKSPDFKYILEYLPETNKYANDFKQVSLENCLKYHNIQSVKRISDNIIFKVGDYIEEGCIINIIIKNFKIYLDIKIIKIEIELKNAIKKEKLFCTEDGVDIYEGDYFCSVFTQDYGSSKAFTLVETKNATTMYKRPSNRIVDFSTKEAAEEYILMNKPCSSIKDILDINKELLKQILKNKQ